MQLTSMPLTLPRSLPRPRPRSSPITTSVSRVRTCRCGCRSASACSCSCFVHFPASRSISGGLNTITRPQARALHIPSFTRPTTARSLSRLHLPLNPQRTISTMSQDYKLKDLSSLASVSPYEKREVEVEGIQDGKVLLLNHNGQVHALSPRCTHYGAPLKNGVVTPDGRLTCPWHGGMFTPLPTSVYILGNKERKY